MAIYLPPGYEVSHQRYPVIYVLQNGSYRGDFDQHHASAVFDQAIAKDVIPPSIVVAADFSTPLGPSWYVNSPITGNWDDFAVKELVPYVDANFRTLTSRSSRAIIGSYLGGYGALRLGILHPDIFGTVYAMHPVGTGSGVQVFTARPDWALLMSAMSIDQVKNAGFSTLFLTMFQAFLPNETNAPLYADLPMKGSSGSYAVDTERMKILRSRFFISELVPQHLEQIKELGAIKMDWSRNDAIYDHIYSNQAFTHLLNEYGIEHEAEEFNGVGDPYWGKQSRMLKEVLPFLAEHLQTDSK
ncbi:alpha/beta hydrolase-fold protein [Edaphobacter albus]|uniref:alpha/beta hydrolase-fold protein n=1 Tax=Edaphobacter sp. 4G125 TaxID=2763071 RepID=UPI001646EC33|nr:alpha/beta hydrolase-fold protein [Edaphobacter sp. 4G125]QNI37850.1 esterase [Edaphobacter sp. 4G125]